MPGTGKFIVERFSSVSIKRLLIAVMIFAGGISVSRGFIVSQLSSKDMQWSGARLLLNGINPFAVAISGNMHGDIILTQAPNYLHLLYFILLPLGAMSFRFAKLVWFVLNIFAVVAIFILIRKRKVLEKDDFFLVLSLFLMSAPLRGGLGNGQLSIVVLFCFFITVLSANRYERGIYGVLGICKYSFAPPFLMHLVYEKKFHEIMVIASAHVLAIIGFSCFFGLNPLSALGLPLKVSEITVHLGVGDLMTLMHILGWNVSGFVYVVPVFVSVLLYFGYVLTTRRDPMFDMAFLSVLSLLCFIHLLYDFVFLLPVVVVCAKNGWRNNVLPIIVVLWFWDAPPVIDFKYLTVGVYEFITVLNVVMLFFLLFKLWENNRCVNGGEQGSVARTLFNN